MTRHNSRQRPSGHHVDGQLALPLVPILPWARRVDLARRIEPDWQDRAACADTIDPEIFFPDDPDADSPINGTYSAEGSVTQLVDVDPAWLCTTCPVTRSCLIVALLHDEHGIWGHTTEAQRDELAVQLVAAGNDNLDELLNAASPSTASATPAKTRASTSTDLREAS